MYRCHKATIHQNEALALEDNVELTDLPKKLVLHTLARWVRVHIEQA